VASESVEHGIYENIDLLTVQRSINNLEQIFYFYGIKDEVLSPIDLVGPLIDAYFTSFNSSLAAGNDT